MHLPSVLTFALAVRIAASIPTPEPYVLHERQETASSHWEKLAKASPNAKLSVRVGLTQRNLHLGPKYLQEISDPVSLKYGKHWTVEQIVDFFSPADESIKSVRAWLKQAGISEDRQSLTPKRGWIWFESYVREMEALLNTEYHLFQHRETRDHYIGCDDYSIPMGLRPHIDVITSTVSSSRRGTKDIRTRSNRGSSSHQVILGAVSTQHSGVESLAISDESLENCGQSMTPYCIRALYRIPPNNATDLQEGNNLGIAAFGQSYDQEDLDLFFSNYASNIPNGTHPKLDLMNGAIAPGRTIKDPEVAASSTYGCVITSGGGFSRHFARPAYQQNAVSNFLTNHPPAYNSTQYDSTGRASPDVSLNGARIQAYVNGKTGIHSGTSASAPLFASIINLINQKRLAANKAVVGFLNPTLYANPDAFIDVSSIIMLLGSFWYVIGG
ncbi:MAG: hypothetical protein Q9187_002837 [Circinaria calcarea]